MIILPPELNFIEKQEVWALTGDHDSGHSNLLHTIQGKNIEKVGFKHQFKNLSNTTDFYYQQRFNSSDSEDSLTVHEYLNSQQNVSTTEYWTYGRVIRDLNLETLLSEEVIKLSNGETKRLLIASALIRNPLMLLLDHPLTGLDQKTRDTFGDLIFKVSNSGIRIIVACGPMDIPDGVTYVAVMKNGRVIHTCAREDFKPQDFGFVHEPVINQELLKQLVSAENIQSFETIIRMRDVYVEYDGRKILQNINWHVKQGERWALSGPNGAGKSTLLSLINADNPQAYANDIVLFDRKRGSGESIWDIKKQTGFVSPELYQYFPGDSSCLHVIESGFFDTVGLFRPSDPAKESLCMKWMKLLQVDNYSSRLFSMVPSDVQRLCLLARALVKNPALLILDEPTQGLDISQQQFFTSLIDHICSMSQVTLIFVSHYEHHIPKAVTRHLRLNGGKQLT